MYCAFTVIYHYHNGALVVSNYNSTKTAPCFVIRESVFNNSSAGNVLTVVQFGIKTHIRVPDNCVNLVNSSSPSICPRRPLR